MQLLKSTRQSLASKRALELLRSGRGLSTEHLDRLWRTGKLPLEVARALRVDDAVQWAVGLPPAKPATGDARIPDGYGLFPPDGAEPIVRVRHALTDPHGEPIPARAKGFVGVLWRSPRREVPVFRLWFRGEVRPRGPVDCYADSIASIVTIGGTVPALVGWTVGRLDGAELAGEDGG